MRVHLIDGTYELFRAYFGAPSATSPAGAEIGAARTLLRSLSTLLRSGVVTHVACAFDHVIESFRNELFAGYKTGEGVDPELLSQFPLAERVTRALGVVAWPMVDFEADDALATAAARYGGDARVSEVRIVSPDKDLAQCVRGARIVLWDRARDRVIDEDGVREKWGISPASIPDWLSLVGDSADGIPGIPRWGARSSSILLARYAHIDAIPLDAEAWDVRVRGAKALAASLRAHREEAELYRRLATLRVDVPIEESLDALEWRGPDEQALAALIEELEGDR